ncbi:MAG: TIGR00282 family metallophosphoesterase, partial [Clostridia bacterium]|nr:TIGR00282 family metallophosphoesterase [Clostridia bacterium]
MKILFIGDIVGRPGRKLVGDLLPVLRKEYDIELVIANGENAAGGSGITPAVAEELFGKGIHILTSGNHIWDKKEAVPYIDTEPRIIRPANYPPGTPGQGWSLISTPSGVNVGVACLAGRVFLPAIDCPFRVGREIVEELKQHTRIIIVDFHAEATSEKLALGWFLDGLVTAVVGTHTHVQTADERILDEGTAYITDVGMVGPRDSVIGIKKEVVIQKFLTQLPVRFEVAAGPVEFGAVVIEVDEATGRARTIERVRV